MAISQEIVDAYVARRAELVRYEGKVVREVLGILQRGEEQAVGAITNAYGDYLDSVGGYGNAWDGRGVATRRRILRRVRAALDDVFPEAAESVKAALNQVATDEMTHFVNTMEETLPDFVIDETRLSSVPERQLANIVDDAFGERFKDEAGEWVGSVGKTFDSIKGDTLTRVNQVVTDGIRDGVGTRNMISRARAKLGVRKGDALYNDIARFVRTSVQTTANDVAGQLYRENRDIVKKEQFVATLDHDTCPQCGPLDGKAFDIDEKGTPGLQRPPLHPNCRCFTAPVLKKWDEMGFDGDVSDEFKRLFDGEPAPRTTWSDWVQRNPDRLDRAIGPARAAKVRAGKVKLPDLYDPKRDQLYGVGELPGDTGPVSIGKVLL